MPYIKPLVEPPLSVYKDEAITAIQKGIKT